MSASARVCGLTRCRTSSSEPFLMARCSGVCTLWLRTLELTSTCTLRRNITDSTSSSWMALCRKLQPWLSYCRGEQSAVSLASHPVACPTHLPHPPAQQPPTLS